MKKFLLTKFLFLLLISSAAWAQEKTVSGKVTSSEDGTPLPGVSVLLKGTTNGTVTDSDGKYSLLVNGGGNQFLIFSFIGLKSTEIEIGERSIVDISLGLDITQLSEVVVVGHRERQKKRKR